MDWKKEIRRCSRCGKCRSLCPDFLASRSEQRSPRGRILLAEDYADGKLDLSRRLDEYMATCLGCLSCEADCPSGVQYSLVVQQMREELSKRRPGRALANIALRSLLTRRTLFDASMRVFAWAARNFRPEGARVKLGPAFLAGLRHAREPAPISVLESLHGENKRAPSARPRQAGRRVLFFVGCLIDYVYPDIFFSARRVLESLGVEVIVPEAQLCCGHPALYLGDRGTFRKLAMHNLRAFSTFEDADIVNACAACGHVLRREYGRFAGPEFKAFSSRVYDFAEYVAMLGGKAKGKLSGLMTYQDPCRLRFGQDIFEQPRALLKSAGEFVEMDGADKCCGGGGLFSVLHYDAAARIAEPKVNSIRRSGAGTVATGCPGCIMHLEDRLSAEGVPVKVRHTAEILAEAGCERSRTGAGASSPRVRASI